MLGGKAHIGVHVGLGPVLKQASLGSLGLSWLATRCHCALAGWALSLRRRHEGRDRIRLPCEVSRCRRATASRLAAKRIYKPRRGLNDISVLSKSYYVRSFSRDKAVIWRMSV
jgi:hypothetical protein